MPVLSVVPWLSEAEAVLRGNGCCAEQGRARHPPERPSHGASLVSGIVLIAFSITSSRPMYPPPVRPHPHDCHLQTCDITVSARRKALGRGSLVDTQLSSALSTGSPICYRVHSETLEATVHTQPHLELSVHRLEKRLLAHVRNQYSRDLRRAARITRRTWPRYAAV